MGSNIPGKKQRDMSKGRRITFISFPNSKEKEALYALADYVLERKTIKGSPMLKDVIVQGFGMAEYILISYKSRNI